MSVVIETTLGDLTVDLFLDKRPRTCLNFVKLCKLKYYNYNLFHNITHDFIAQTGDPSGSGHSGSSVWGILEGGHKRYFQTETAPKIKHSDVGLISMVSTGDGMIGSQFFFTLASDLLSLDESHCVFGEVVEGMEVLRLLNETICDEKARPYKDVRITHTVILDDPFENPRGFREPSRSPSPSAERLKGGRIAADEDINDTAGKTEAEVNEMLREQEAKAQATILEIVGDLPDADMAPPENVLFVCKLNPVTNDDDLEIIFSRFGKIKACEVIRDKQSGDSLQYAFVEFEEQKSCEDAYFKMDNVLIDDRRIHVDFSQSVAKLQWKGKGRGVVELDERGNGGGRNGGARGGNQARNPKINFNDKNWKNGRGRRSSRSPVAREMRRNDKSPMRRIRSRSKSPVRRGENSRAKDDAQRRRDEGERGRRQGDNRRDYLGRRFDEERRGNRPGNDRSRSPRRRREDDRQPVTRHSDGRDRRCRSRSGDNARDSSRRSDTYSDDRREMRRRKEGSPIAVAQRDRSGSRSKVAKKRSSSCSESGSSDNDESKIQKKKAKKKEAKQKRNKTKKSKVSRTSSDDDSSSSSSSTSSGSDRRKSSRKKAKKSKKKHKKNR